MWGCSICNNHYSAFQEHVALCGITYKTREHLQEIPKPIQIFMHALPLLLVTIFILVDLIYIYSQMSLSVSNSCITQQCCMNNIGSYCERMDCDVIVRCKKYQKCCIFLSTGIYDYKKWNTLYTPKPQIPLSQNKRWLYCIQEFRWFVLLHFQSCISLKPVIGIQ